MFIKCKNTAIIGLLFSLMSMFAFSQTNPSPEPPVISRVSQDRLMVNDLLTITGRNFIPAGDFPQTFVVFKDLPPILVIPPASDTKISVLVPEGAKSGDIKVKTVCAVDETTYELESNPLKILILWKEISLTAIANAISPDPARPYRFWNYLFPGANDDVFAFFVNSYNKTDPSKVVQIYGDGSWVPVQFPPSYYNIPLFASSSFIAMDPIDYEYTYCFYSPSTNPRYSCLVAPAFSSICKQTYPTPQWAPFEVGYDNEGRLYVLGRLTTNQPPYVSTSSIWRFNRGESVNLDPNSVNSLFPGGFYGDLGNLTVAGDGSVYVQYYSLTSTQMIYIPSNGTGYQLYQWPTGNYAYCEDQWKMTADCSGRGYAINPDPWCNTPTIYSLPGNVPVAMLPAGLTTDGLDYITHDGYGNLFVSTKHTGTNNDVIRRITPQDMPQGYYDCFSCCPNESFRSEADTCGNGVGDIHECEEGFAIELITNTTGNTEAETKICIDMSNPPPSVDVLFGDAPILNFYSAKDCGGVSVSVSWEIAKDASGNYIEEVESELDLDGNSLFPNNPEIIFAGNPKGGTTEVLQFQNVHTGKFKLKLTKVNGKELSNPVEFLVKIVKPAKLGSSQNQYDVNIIKYADKYGIPPQYIKGQAQQESGLKADSYRYELRTMDKNLVSKKGSDYWSDPLLNLQYYRLEATTNSNLNPNDVSPRGKYKYISNFNKDLTPPEWPYSCAAIPSVYPFNDVDSPVRDPIKLFDIFEANDGWPHLTCPWKAYNPQAHLPDGSWDSSKEVRFGPCARIGWFDSESPYNTGLETTITYMRATDTFYCGVIVDEDDPQQCAGNETESSWLLNNKKTYIAQTVIASSYGLMQTLYETAVRTMKWKEGVGREAERHPYLLFDADVSLDLGVRYDALQMTKVIGGQSKNYTTLDSYLADLRTAIGAYNSGKPKKPSKWYADKVFYFATNNYEPKN